MYMYVYSNFRRRTLNIIQGHAGCCSKTFFKHCKYYYMYVYNVVGCCLTPLSVALLLLVYMYIYYSELTCSCILVNVAFSVSSSVVPTAKPIYICTCIIHSCMYNIICTCTVLHVHCILHVGKICTEIILLLTITAL